MPRFASNMTFQTALSLKVVHFAERLDNTSQCQPQNMKFVDPLLTFNGAPAYPSDSIPTFPTVLLLTLPLYYLALASRLKRIFSTCSTTPLLKGQVKPKCKTMVKHCPDFLPRFWVSLSLQGFCPGALLIPAIYVSFTQQHSKCLNVLKSLRPSPVPCWQCSLPVSRLWSKHLLLKSHSVMAEGRGMDDVPSCEPQGSENRSTLFKRRDISFINGGATIQSLKATKRKINLY